MAEEFVEVGRLTLRIRRRGHGVPLLLIGGLGSNLALWENVTDALPGIESIAVDGPGTGRSTTPRRAMSMVELAGVYTDLLAVLGVGRAAVLGFSFGGAVAQQMAHQSPAVVRRLVLCATGPGLGGILGNPLALQELATPARYYSASRLRRVTPLVYGGRLAHASQESEGYADERLRHPPSVVGYVQQLCALAGWSSLPWLSRLAAPTLVLAGDADPVFPVGNAAIFGSLVPDCRVEILRGAGHLFVVDSAAEIAPGITRFVVGG